MTRKPPQKPVSRLAEHRARPPHRFHQAKPARIKGDDTNTTFHVELEESDEDRNYLNNVRQHWGPTLIESAERDMVAILVAAGLPVAPGVFTPTSPDGRYGFRGLDKLAVRRGHQIGSALWFACAILEGIASARTAMAGGEPEQILHESLHLGALMREASIVVPDGHIFDFGLKMWDGRKRPRQDVLAQLIDDALEQLGSNASTDEVLEHIRKTRKVDIDIDRSIAWTNAHGASKITVFKTFQNRLAGHRRKKACVPNPQK